MKILIANYLYFIEGGPGRYLFSISKTLREKGHEVIPFSINYTKNIPTPFSKYFISSIGTEDQIFFRDYSLNPKTIFKLMSRSFYSIEAKKAIQKEIKMENPDIAYFLHFINKISPSIIDGCKELNIPVVLRLSDFYLMCPNELLFRRNQVCEKCLNGILFHAFIGKCVKNSRLASMVKVCSMYLHSFLKIFNKVDAFITPSKFLKEKMIKVGFDKEKIYVIPNFINYLDIIPSYSNNNYILYLGRISEEKGVECLIHAFKLLNDKKLQLKITGDLENAYAKSLYQYVQREKIKNIEFVGFEKGKSLVNLIKNCSFIVVPSMWYENNPNSILEAFAFGKPVVASNLGSIPEVVKEGYNGLLFQPKDYEKLAEKMKKLLDDQTYLINLGRNAREEVERCYGPENHIYNLTKLFNSITEKD